MVVKTTDLCTVWVPITLSQPLTWCLPGTGKGEVQDPVARKPLAQALSVLAPLLFAYMAALPVLGWLASLARPRPCQGCGDLDPASPGRRAAAPGEDPEAVLGRSGGPGRAGAAPALAISASRPWSSPRRLCCAGMLTWSSGAGPTHAALPAGPRPRSRYGRWCWRWRGIIRGRATGASTAS